MNELAQALRAQAAATRPRADFEDVLRRAHTRHRRVVAARAVAAVAVVLAVGTGAVTVAVTRDSSRDRATPVVARAPRGLPALVIGGLVHALDRVDSGAVRGPWTVVVRRAGGSLGSHGAVVTFPVPAVASGRPVTVNGTIGRLGTGQLVWPVAGAHARVRGDLTDAQLLQIARRTSVADGRPSVRPPRGITVISTGPYRAPVIHEARTMSSKLGEVSDLGNGLAYAGVLRAGGFEDQLYATHGHEGYRVDGHPAVLSSVQGGNGTLAWEPSPGVVAFVGYSGSTLTDGAARALVRVADRTRFVSEHAWQSLRPQAAEQVNDFT